MTMDSDIEDRIAEWMASHGYDEPSKGRAAARALMFFLDRYGYAIVPADDVKEDQ